MIQTYTPTNAKAFSSLLPEKGLPKSPTATSIAKCWYQINNVLNSLKGIDLVMVYESISGRPTKYISSTTEG